MAKRPKQTSKKMPSKSIFDQFNPERALKLAIGLHITLFILIIFPWPEGKKDDISPPPIILDIAPLADKTETPEIQDIQNDADEAKPEPPKKKEAERDIAPQVTEIAPPPPQILKDKMDPPKEEPEPEEAPKPEPPKEIKKPSAKPKPPERPEPEKKEPEPEKEEVEDEKKEEEPKPKKTLDSLLKNLADTDGAKKSEDNADSSSKMLKAPLGENLTVSEVDALRQQIAQCWTIPIGARNAEDIRVTLIMTVSQDRVVTSAIIKDTARYANDPFFAAAADSAVRAVKSPLCTPLNLPQDKYDQWRSLEMTFDPKDYL